MNTRAFVSLLVVVLVLGASLGGAFAGDVALGKSQGDGGSQSTLTTQSPPGSGQQSSSQPSQTQLQQFRQRLQSGELSPEEMDQVRQQFQGQFGQGDFQGFAGRGRLTGAIEKIEGNTVTINTQQGPLLATIGTDTVIQKFAQGTFEDLQAGIQVTVVGQRGEDGTVAAISIVITPEGLGSFPSGAFSGGGPRGSQ